MPKYIGSDVTYGFLTKQTLDTDGVSSSFSLDSRVASPNALLISYGGNLLEPGVDYSLSSGGKIVNFTFTPTLGSSLYIIFLGKELSIPAVAGNEPIYYSSTGNGSNTDFTVSGVPGVLVPEATLVFVTGVQKKYSDDWTIVGNSTIRFNVAPINASKISIHVWGVSRNDIYEFNITALDNNSYLTGINAAGNGNVRLIKADSSDNTVINAETGKSINFSVNNSPILATNSTSIQPNTDNTFDVGSLTKRFKDIYTSGSIRLANAQSLQSRNQANSAWLNLISSNTSNNTILNTAASGEFAFQVAGTDAHKINTTAIFPATNNAKDLGTSSLTYRSIYASTNLIYSVGSGAFYIRPNSSDNSDSSTLVLSGGGADTPSTARGAYLIIRGNEAVSGAITMSTGAKDSSSHMTFIANGGSIIFQTNGSNIRWSIDNTGHFIPGADNSYDIGALATRVKDIYTSGNIKIASNSYIQARNNANTSYLSLLKSDTTDNTILNAATGQTVQFAINGTTSILVSSTAINPATDNAVDLGSLSTRFKDIYFSGNLKLPSNVYLQSRNNANNAYLDLIKADSSDNTVVNTPTGKTINLSINGSSVLNLSATALLPNTDNTIDVGSLTNRIKDLYLSNNLYIANSKSLSFRNSGNSAWVSVLSYGASGYLDVNAETAMSLKINGTIIYTVASGNIYPNTTNTKDLGGAAATFRRLYLGTELKYSVGSGTFNISADTTDTTDTSSFMLASGGSTVTDGTRGAIALLKGNEATGGGSILLASGDVSTGSITLKTFNSSSDIIFQTSATDSWTVKGAGHFIPGTDNSYDIGSLTYRLKNLYTSGSIYTASNSYIQARNAANSAWVPLVGLNASDETVINTPSTKKINLSVNNATEFEIAANAFRPGTDNTKDIGSLTLRIKDIYTSGNIKIASNSYIQARNAANSAYINLLKTDGSNNTLLDCDSAGEIQFLINGTKQYGVSSTAIYSNTNNTRDLGTSSLAYRTLYFGTSIIYSNDVRIRANTSDGADNRSILMCGGGDYDSTGGRGANLVLFGAENTQGSAYLITGNTAASTILLKASSSTSTILFQIGGPFERWQMDYNGQFLQHASYGGAIVMARSSASLMRCADDTITLGLAGGSALSASNGGYITLAGNSNAGAGGILIRSGTAASGNITLQSAGSGTSIILTTNGSSRWSFNDAGHFIPSSTNAYDIGSSGNRVKDIYSAGNLYAIKSNIATTLDVTVSDVYATHSSFSSWVQALRADRAANSAYSFSVMQSGVAGSTDTEFNLRGDGNGLCDGSWSGGGADYAEYFESISGEEIPTGTVVVIEDGKVRPVKKTDSEDSIVGVIRPKNGSACAAIGNNPMKWSKKYLKDDFGDYILDKDGNRILNKEFDKKQEYTQRQNRSEWVLVGLLGQIPILKNQKKPAKWLKMKTISEKVDLYFVK